MTLLENVPDDEGALKNHTPFTLPTDASPSAVSGGNNFCIISNEKADKTTVEIFDINRSDPLAALNLREKVLNRAERAGLSPALSFRSLETSSVVNFQTLASYPTQTESAVASFTTLQVPQTVRLPLSLTRFFGRETEMMTLLRGLGGSSPPTPPRTAPDEALIKERLVTVTDSAGAGKTRLALETAQKLSEMDDRAIIFIPLADARNHDAMLSRILEELSVTSLEQNDLFQTAVKALSLNPFLLVLDNFEQLLPAIDAPESDSDWRSDAAEVVFRLMSEAPRLSCLVTSRRRLEIDGEREFPVTPLPAPALSGTPERLMDFSSV